MKKSKKSMTPAEQMADANKRYEAWRTKINSQPYKFVYCPECGTHMYHDFNIIQRHMISCHMKGRQINKEIGWKFVPSTI